MVRTGPPVPILMTQLTVDSQEKLRPRKKRAVIFATLLALIVGGAVTIGLVLGLRSAKGSAGNEDLDAAVPANSSATQTSTTADPSRWSSTESQLTSLRAQAPPTGSTAGPNSASRQPSLSLPSASSLDSPTASSSNTLTSGPLVLPSPTSSTDATAPASNPPTTPTTSRSTNGKEEIGFTRTTSASSAPTPTPPPPPSLFQIFVNITSSCMVSHEGTNYMWGTACETAPSAGSIQLFSGRQNAPWVHKASGLCMVILDSDGFPGLVPCTGGIEQMWTIKDDVLYDGNGKCSTKPKGLETFIIGCARFALLFS
ncbi:hypothetical protein DFJ73DRAFT_809853 [Zopfochytrium polystomum]|nr:hypothetical protein DFJ73DRAFT_809853 [Zopfochytrium polystomum]